jgi:DNA-binding XRE family transcriptional regulator
VNYDIEIELKKIGQKIKEIRLAKRMTQSALASSSDVDIRSIQLIEVGKLNMSLKIFFAISHSLEIKPSDLLDKIEMDSKFRLE